MPPSRSARSGLSLGPRQKSSGYDHFTHHGRHFGRTVHAMCNVTILLQNGLRRTSDAAELDVPVDIESLSTEERMEHLVFEEMLKAIPMLEREIVQADGGERVKEVGKKIQQGINQARGEDAKGLKPNILEWIKPFGDVSDLEGANKSKRGFKHNVTGRLLCPAEMSWDNAELQDNLRKGKVLIPPTSWPIFLYANYEYDAAHPWDGLLRSRLIVTAFKYIFTSPSSVHMQKKATRSGNANLHGMRHVTRGSLAYVAMQVRFALSSSDVFTRSDYALQSEKFYNTLLAFLWTDTEKVEVDALLAWFDGQVFSSTMTTITVPADNSVLATINAQRAAALAAPGAGVSGVPAAVGGTASGAVA